MKSPDPLLRSGAHCPVVLILAVLALLMLGATFPRARAQTTNAVPISTWPSFMAMLTNAANTIAVYKTNSVPMPTYTAATNALATAQAAAQAATNQINAQAGQITLLQAQTGSLTAQQAAAIATGNAIINNNLTPPTPGP